MFAWSLPQATLMCCQRVWNFLANLAKIGQELRAIFFCAIVYPSQTISLHCCNTLPIPDDLEMFHLGVPVDRIFRGNFIAEWAVLPPGSNVAAIPDDARANAVSFLELIDARIHLIRQVLPVPPGASKKKISQLCLFLNFFSLVLVFFYHRYHFQFDWLCFTSACLSSLWNTYRRTFVFLTEI